MRRVFQPGEGEHRLPPRVLLAFVAVVFAFFFSAAALGCGVIQNGKRINDIERVRDAICNLRDDQIRRISRTEQFLEEHPNGIPGISAALLRTDLADRRRVVDALEPLKCPPRDARTS